jgi:hypothetical protein
MAYLVGILQYWTSWTNLKSPIAKKKKKKSNLIYLSKKIQIQRSFLLSIEFATIVLLSLSNNFCIPKVYTPLNSLALSNIKLDIICTCCLTSFLWEPTSHQANFFILKSYTRDFSVFGNVYSFYYTWKLYYKWEFV